MHQLSRIPLSFRVRRMTHDDLPAVMAIESTAFSNPWTTEMVKKELSQDWSTVLLVEEPNGVGHTLLGFSIFWLVHDELHVLNVATDPAHRRRGVARVAMAATVEQARAHRCRIASLEVRRSNLAAIGLYAALGFRPVGLRPNYYVDDREDAVVMAMDLVETPSVSS